MERWYFFNKTLKADSGKRVFIKRRFPAPGAYWLKVTAADQYGAKAQKVGGSFTVTNQNPRVNFYGFDLSYYRDKTYSFAIEMLEDKFDRIVSYSCSWHDSISCGSPSVTGNGKKYFIKPIGSLKMLALSELITKPLILTEDGGFSSGSKTIFVAPNRPPVISINVLLL